MSAPGNKRLYHVSAILYGFCIRSLPPFYAAAASAAATAAAVAAVAGAHVKLNATPAHLYVLQIA